MKIEFKLVTCTRFWGLVLIIICVIYDYVTHSKYNHCSRPNLIIMLFCVVVNLPICPNKQIRIVFKMRTIHFCIFIIYERLPRRKYVHKSVQRLALRQHEPSFLPPITRVTAGFWLIDLNNRQLFWLVDLNPIQGFHWTSAGPPLHSACCTRGVLVSALIVCVVTTGWHCPDYS